MIIEFPRIPPDPDNAVDQAEARLAELERTLEIQLAGVRQIRENLRAARSSPATIPKSQS